MFDFVEKHRRLVMVALLALIAPAFVIVGATTFDFSIGGSGIAEVNGRPINQSEFDNALRRQQAELERQLGRNFDPAMFDSPELRKNVLDRLITQQLLLDYASRNHANISDAQVREVLVRSAGLGDKDGVIAKEELEALARSINMTPEGLLMSVRSQLVEQQLSAGIQGSAFGAKSAAERFARQRAETRIVERVLFPAGQYVGKIDIKPADVESYYQSHTDDFRTPEQVRAEYVVLNRAAFEAEIAVTPEEVQRRYDETAGPKLKAHNEARVKAQALLDELRQHPDRFAETAKAQSLDSASGSQGGELEYFPRGAMVKPFEDAAFKLKAKEFAPLVETQFGFHIIQLLDVRQSGQGEERRVRHILLAAPPAVKDFAGSKVEIERELRQQRLTAKFAEAVENFKDVAYEQPDTLQPVADRFKLKVQSSGWLSRTVGQPPLDQPALLRALFSDDVLRDKRNSEAVEAGSGRWIVARVTEHKPAAVRPLADVRAEIESVLREERSLALALQEGGEKLKALQAGQSTDLKWSRSVALSRERPSELRAEELKTLFRTDVRQLPAYVGMESSRAGYVIYRISKVEQVQKLSPEQLQAATAAMEQLSAAQQRQSFIADLRDRADVEVNEKRLAGDSQQ